MDSTASLFFAFLRSTMTDRPLSPAEIAACTEEALEQIFKLAKRHDLSHLLAPALQKSGIAVPENFRNAMFAAVYRAQQKEVALKQICKTLEDAKIPFIPLKGSVLRKLYPEPWMRTSCDIDILLKPEDLEKTRDLLVAKFGYEAANMGDHDISLYGPMGGHIELHYTLTAASNTQTSYHILENIWGNAQPVSEAQYHMKLSDEDFYFYHITHMAKHFLAGGCGIRPLLDLWLLDKQPNPSRDDLLAQADLLTFTLAMRKLIRHWLERTPCDESIERIQSYIITGGVYGTESNRVLVQQKQKGNKVKYILSRIFLPYKYLKFQYPILRKYKILTPIMQVRRWCRLFLGHKFQKSVRELQVSQSITPEQQEGLIQLLKDVGL